MDDIASWYRGAVHQCLNDPTSAANVECNLRVSLLGDATLGASLREVLLASVRAVAQQISDGEFKPSEDGKNLGVGLGHYLFPRSSYAPHALSMDTE